MKKSLIIPALATLLAVSCGQGGGSGNGKKDWNADLKDAMDLTLGEVLPFASLDSKTTEYQYYSFFGYGGVIEIQDENKKNVLTDYDTKLTKAGFAYEEVPEEEEGYLRLEGEEDPTGDEEEEEPVFAWHKETFLGDLWVSYGWLDEYVGPDAEGKPTVFPAGNIIAASLAYYEGYYESADFPFDLLQRFFRHYDILIDEQMVPAFNAAAPEAYYQFDASWASYADWVDVYVNYATSAELKAYKDALVAAGWTVTSEETEETEDWTLTFENSGAWVDLVDFTAEEEPYVALSFYYILPPVFEIGFEEVEEFYGEYGIEAPLAAYEGEALWFEVDVDLEYETVTYYIDGSSHDEMDAFAEALEEAGWTLETDSYGDYEGFYGRTQANVYIGDYIGYSLDCIVVEFSVGPEVYLEINFSEALEAISELGYEVLLPAYRTYTDGRLSYQVSEDGLQYYISGTTEAELNAFVAVLAACGWDMSEPNSYGDVTGSYGNVNISVENYIGGWYYDGVFVTFTFNRWDSELIAAYYAYKGIEDEVPVPEYVSSLEDAIFTFDASYVSYGYPLFAYVENTTEEDLMGDGLEEDGYFGLLFEAGWNLTNYVFNDDGTSEFEWFMQVGDYDAYIYILDNLATEDYVEFEFYATEHVEPAVEVDEFPLDLVNAFLTQYELGFQLETGLPQLLGGEGYTYKTGSNGGYHFFRVEIDGNNYEAWVEALDALLTANGYTQKAASYGVYYANEDDHQVSIGYDSTNEVTFVVFWE